MSLGYAILTAVQQSRVLHYGRGYGIHQSDIGGNSIPPCVSRILTASVGPLLSPQPPNSAPVGPLFPVNVASLNPRYGST